MFAFGNSGEGLATPYGAIAAALVIITQEVSTITRFHIINKVWHYDFSAADSAEKVCSKVRFNSISNYAKIPKSPLRTNRFQFIGGLGKIEVWRPQSVSSNKSKCE